MRAYEDCYRNRESDEVSIKASFQSFPLKIEMKHPLQMLLLTCWKAYTFFCDSCSVAYTLPGVTDADSVRMQSSLTSS
jgi:hypothetical protein